MLAAAMNPCPCGHLGDTRKPCVCSPKQIALYLARLSGPLLDRIDIHIEVPSLAFEDMAASTAAESSAAVRQRVQAARQVQEARFGAEPKGRARPAHCNAQMGPRSIKVHCKLEKEGVAMLRAAVERLGLSARAYDRILKVARTIADLEHSEAIGVQHLSEAIQYRTLDRRGRGTAAN
jgi:magnesium chelatase family protein